MHLIFIGAGLWNVEFLEFSGMDTKEEVRMQLENALQTAKASHFRRRRALILLNCEMLIFRKYYQLIYFFLLEYNFKCYLFLASLLQSSVLHDPSEIILIR